MATQGAGGPTVQNQGGPANPFTQQQGGGPAVDSVNNGLQLLTAKLASLAATVVATQVAMTSTSKTTTALAGQTASQLKKLTEASINSVTSELAALEAASLASAQALDHSTTVTRTKNKLVEDEIAGILHKVRTDKEANDVADKNIKSKNAELIASGKSFASLKSSISSIESAQKKTRESLAKSAAELDLLGKRLQSSGGTDPKLLAEIKSKGAAYDNNRRKLEILDNQYNAHNVVLGNHKTLLGSVNGKLLGFISSLGLGTTLMNLANEANEAKTTGNYAGAGDFLGGQLSALLMGVSSKMYNDLRAQTRGSAMTDTSQAAFDDKLSAATTKMTEMAGDRAEGAKLAGATLASTATVGISAEVAAKNMDALGDGFNKLSKITGKTVGEMAELTFAITKDVDHRAIMLGMNGEERARYLLAQQQQLTKLKLDGYSIEQAQELQKLAMQTRTQGIQERISKQAGLQQSMYRAASMFQGPQADAMRATAAKQAELDVRGRGILTPEQRNALDVEKKANTAKYTAQLEEANKTQGSSEVAAGMLADVLKKIAETSGITAGANAAAEAPKEATIKAKSEEKAQGASTAMKTFDWITGHVTALGANTAMMVVLAGAMTALTMATWKAAGGKAGLGGLAELVGGDKKLAAIKTTIGEAKTALKPSNIMANAAEGVKTLRSGREGIRSTIGKMGIGSKALGVAGIGLAAMNTYDESNDVSAKVKSGEMTEQAGTVKKAGLWSGLAGGTAGAAAGAVVGQALIPIPVVGALIGGAVGSWLGKTAGEAGGEKIAGLATTKEGTAALKPPGTSTDLSAKVDTSRAAAEKQQRAAMDAVALGKPLNEVQAAQAMEKPTTKPAQQSIDELQRQFYLKGIAFYDAVDPASDKDMKQKHLNLLRQTAMQGNLASSNFAQAPVTQGA